MSSAENRLVARQPAGVRRRPGMRDSTLVKLFIWPTLALLIAMNVFPLFYSLILSFHKYSAISNKPAVFVGLQNLELSAFVSALHRLAHPVAFLRRTPRSAGAPWNTTSPSTKPSKRRTPTAPPRP